MPIKKENREKYPKNWKAISQRIRFIRADGKCEFCGLKHGEKGARNKNGVWFSQEQLLISNPDWFVKSNFKIVTIILTCAHLNHNETDCRDENLAALCQRCHLRYDNEHHKMNSAFTRENKKGTRNLFI